MTTYEVGLGSSGNFKQQRMAVEAETLKEAIDIAQAEYPGMLVYSAWAMDGGTEPDPKAEAKWMKEHRKPKNLSS